MIDFWDLANIHHTKTKIILEENIVIVTDYQRVTFMISITTFNICPKNIFISA